MAVLLGGRWARALVSVGILLGMLTGCGDESPDEVPMPGGVSVDIDQSRIKRSSREVYLRVENDSRRKIVVEQFRLTSPRLAEVRWEGDEVVGAGFETDLEFTMPRGRCGDDLAATAELTYRVANGDLRRSTTAVDDPYGNATELANRDCARLTLEEAAEVVVGEPKIVGTGADAVLALPVTMTPTGRRDDVRFDGFGNTPLFRQAPGSPVGVDVPLGADDPAVSVTMRVVPARCDPHALAEDKVGRLFPVHVVADDVGPDGSYFLPLTASQRKAFYAYFRVRCGS